MIEPRTILYVGNFTRPWCTEVHLAASLEALGHRVVRLQENTLDWSAVPAAADTEQAHMLLWTRTWPTDLDVVVPQLDRLREIGVPSVSYHLDLFLGLDREHQVTDQPFFHTDLLVTPHRSERWAELGVNHLWQPPGVFDQECGIVAPNRRVWPYDVVFVGSHPYPHPEWEPTRTALIDRFRAEFGPRFAVLPLKGHPIRGAALQVLYATVPVILGDSCLAGQVDGYWSDRVPETLGRGGLLIHPEIPGDIGPGGAWYDEGVVASFPSGDPAFATAVARDLLADPAEAAAIREAGRKLVLGRDTYRHRMETMLDHVAETIGWRVPPAPPLAPRPAMAVRLHRYQARFEPRPGDVGAVDVSVVDEVWKANDYRVGPPGFRGTVLDIGGNIGAFSVLAAKAGASKVVAFEPHSLNRDRLVHHAELNRVMVDVLPYAVVGAVERGTVAIVGDGGGAHIDPALTATGTNGGMRSISIGLAEVLATFGPIEFLKMDIEGGEYDALSGVTANDLATHVARMSLEFHGPHMPHLGHLNDDGRHIERWGAMVALLADCGRIETFGHPMVGGLLHWARY